MALTDIPYFNGYYVKTGNPVVVAYPKNDYVIIANSNTDFWTPFGLEDGMTVTVTLNESAKYLATQEALGQSYSVDRADFASDFISCLHIFRLYAIITFAAEVSELADEQD